MFLALTNTGTTLQEVLNDENLIEATETALLALVNGPCAPRHGTPMTAENYTFVFHATPEAIAEGLSDITLNLREHAQETLHSIYEMREKAITGELTLGENALSQMAHEIEQGSDLTRMMLAAYNAGIRERQTIAGAF